MELAQLIRSKWIVAAQVLSCGLLLNGCIAAVPDDSASADEEELWDEGALADEEAAGEETGTLTSELSGAPLFQLPFPCGQVWSGQTRTNHSPVNSVDFNRTDDLGDTVVAAAAGKVTRVANLGNTSYGRWIEIDHGNGYRTRYAHLSSQIVSVGQSVSQGQKIGAVGNTGGSSGPHLHYELRRNNIALRPVFNGATAYFYGTRSYTSKNKCSKTTGATGTVNTSGAELTVRANASTSSAAVGSLADGTKVTITCQKHGTSVTGTYGTTTLWDFVGNGYVSDAYMMTGSDGQVAPTCP